MWAVELPKLTEDALRGQVIGEEGQNTYLRAYLAWLPDTNNEDNCTAWFDALDATCAWLGEAVMGPLMAALEQHLPPESQVVLIPSGWLALLPLHAARLPGSQAYALDRFCFTYAPSAQALYHARRQAASAPADALLAVENPRGDLPFTSQEVKAALEHFRDQAVHLPEKRATRKNVLRDIPKANVLHFSTHGLAGWGEAEAARLVLADGELTLAEVYRLKLDQARLAVLSACETAIPGLEVPDEVSSLPSGWMQAGVPGVVGTLWSVNDLSTALLIARFYDLWRNQPLPLPQALPQAQRWLRDRTAGELAEEMKSSLPEFQRLSASVAGEFFQRLRLSYSPIDRFDHPYHWAGFIFVGI